MSELRTSATHGRACTNCAKDKSKCTFPVQSSICERCHRLNKECRAPSGVRKTPGRKPVSQTAQLHEKLEDLVTLLRSTSSTDAATQARLVQQVHREPHDSGFSISEKPTPVGAEYSSPSSIPVADDNILPSEAEECLELFRSQKLKYFPFINLPPFVTSSQLREERPVLWLSILAASVKSISRQQALGTRFRKSIAEIVVVQHQRNLDVLLGILGFLGWAHYHLTRQPFLILYSHLGAAIVQDLGLDRPPPIVSAVDAHPAASLKRHGFVINGEPSAVRTMEERRALVACYLITKTVTAFQRKPAVLGWNQYMEECLIVLDEAQETHLDCVLVQQIRLQRISDESPSPIVNHLGLPEQVKLYREFQTKVLVSKIEELRQKLVPYLPEDLATICRFHAITAEVEINEATLFETSPKASTPNMRRTSILSMCLQLSKAWFDEALLQHPANLFMFSFHILSQMAYLTGVLYKLSMLEDPDWDKAVTRQTIDVLQLIDAMVEKFTQVPIACGFIDNEPAEDIFSKIAKTTTAMKAAWEAVFLQTQGADMGSVGPVGDIYGNVRFDIPDGLNGWFADMVGSGWDPTSHMHAEGMY